MSLLISCFLGFALGIVWATAGMTYNTWQYWVSWAIVIAMLVNL